jgi:Tfp pilus assembly protein PilV
LVELVVALVMLGVGLLGLSAAIGVIARMTTASALMAQARFAARAQIEALLAMPPDRLAPGEWRRGELVMVWQVSGDEPRQIVLGVRHALGSQEVRDTLTTVARFP